MPYLLDDFPPPEEYVSLRIGDNDNYEPYWDLEEAIDALQEASVTNPIRWRKAGFENDDFQGDNYVSMFWGDEKSDFIRELSDEEKRVVEKQLLTVAERDEEGWFPKSDTD